MVIKCNKSAYCKKDNKVILIELVIKNTKIVTKVIIKFSCINDNKLSVMVK